MTKSSFLKVDFLDMVQKRVSVIIPNYNHAKYLKQRIETVLNQTYQNFEVILLDDCSTDDSQSIINSYRSNPAVSHVEFNAKNTGSPFKQWEKGLQLAVGEWIWIAESDDYADEKFLETMIFSIPDEDRYGLLYCDSHVVIDGIVQDGTFASRRNRSLNTVYWENSYSNNGIAEIRDYLMAYGTINNTSAVLFKREVLKRVNPFDMPFRFIGDKYTFVKVLSVSDIRFVSAPLNYYRASADFKPKHTQDYFDYFYEQFLVFDWIYRNLKTIEKGKILEAFKLNTELSLISINRKKLQALIGLIAINKKLLLYVLWNNLVRTLKRGMKR